VSDEGSALPSATTAPQRQISDAPRQLEARQAVEEREYAVPQTAHRQRVPLHREQHLESVVMSAR